MPQPVEEKYLSYFRQEMRITAETNGRNGDIAEAMVDSDAEVPGISEKGKLLTLTTQTALEHKMADVEAKSLEEALTKLGYSGPITKLDRTWSEVLVGFLTSTAIASLLLVAMVVLGYLEYQAPGFGVFGSGALACFLLLYFSHYLVNLAGWEELLLFCLGAALLFIEIFVTPGVGLVGLSGMLCILTSVVLLLMAGDWGDISISNPITVAALVRVLISLVLGIISVALMFRFLPKTESSGIGGRLILTTALGRETGFRSHEEVSQDLTGCRGVALTALRPAGKARIEGKRLNVETEGGFIDQGEELKVLRQEPGRVIVRRA
jgi:membrane-bound serine protease (ClpP class)